MATQQHARAWNEPESRMANKPARKSRGWIGAIFVLLLAALLSSSAHAAIFTVNSRSDDGDDNPGNGACQTGDLIFTGSVFLQECTLRAALEEANARPGFDEIRFSTFLPKVAGVVEFTPTSEYPPLTDPVLIDGYSHPDYDNTETDSIPTPIINLVGTSAGALTPGLRVFATGSGSTIRGLAISNFQVGIDLNPGQPPGGLGGPTGVVIQGNHIGILRGALTSGNSYSGISITGSQNNLVGKACSAVSGCIGRGNLVSANATGIRVRGDASNNRIAGNFIGTGRYGLSTSIPFSGSTGNLAYGIHFVSDVNATDVEIGSVGSTFDAATQDFIQVSAGNVISGNGYFGIRVDGSLDFEMQANMIGTNRLGTVALPNQSGGVILSSFANLSSSSRIGTGGVGGNTISGNQGFGIYCGSNSPLTIQYNRIGTNAAGNAPLPNNGDGIYQSQCNVTVRYNIIGGNNGSGIHLTGVSTIEDNWIGTNASGDALPNTDDGIRDEGYNASIGGPERGNIIGLNGGNGIYSIGTATTIEGNYIGTDPAGRDLGNTLSGIHYGRFAGLAEVGAVDGLTNGLGNTIGNNGLYGIQFEYAYAENESYVVHGNYIGTDESGRKLGNLLGGIHTERSQIEIGAPLGASDLDVERHANVFGYNPGQAIRLDEFAYEVPIRGNRFNDDSPDAGRPIRHSEFSSGANDPGDFDGGGNRGQNYPEFGANAAIYDETTGVMEIQYRVDSDPSASIYPLRVDFYVGDPTTYPDEVVGAFIGSDLYPESAAGAARSISFAPLAGTIAPDSEGNVEANLFAIATDANGNSSELSPQNVPVPEPGFAGALGCGLVGLVALRGSRPA